LAEKVDGISAPSSNRQQREKRLEHPFICGRLDFGDRFLTTNELGLYRGDGASHAAPE
jgi:hypothetical protein